MRYPSTAATASPDTVADVGRSKPGSPAYLMELMWVIPKQAK